MAVSSYPANGLGRHEIVGNVGEWLADYYNWLRLLSPPQSMWIMIAIESARPAASLTPLMPAESSAVNFSHRSGVS